MNKYNKLGMELLEYKEELSKVYPDIVLKSLQSSIDSLANNRIIDVDTHYALKESSVNINDLKELLLNKTACLKTYEELFDEYEVIRDNFNNELGINSRDDIQTQSVVDKEQILLMQDFIMKEDFLQEYFFIESEKDYETLMGRKGFMHKFAILRLEKIMRDFLKNELKTDLDVSYTAVFFHEKKNVYGIQLMFSYSVNDLENDEKLKELSIETKNILEKALEYYNRKMIA